MSSTRPNSSRSSLDNSQVDDTAPTPAEWLKERLENARVECALLPHSFIVPRDVQEDLITESRITNVIRAHSSNISEDRAKAYAKKTYQYAPHLFATLAFIKRGADICALLDEGITDETLPLVRKQDDRSALYRKDGTPIKAMKTWQWKHLEKFDRVQWWIISHVFNYGEHYRLDEKTILPFIPLGANEGTLVKKQGGYSELYPVRIHSAHHKFWPNIRQDNKPLVAVKALFSSDRREFERESEILYALGCKDHPHLIKLLATYEIGNNFHLMFPYANANLRKYWEDHATPSFDANTVLWSLQQMSGFASGLSLLHNYKVTIPASGLDPKISNIRLTNGRVIELEFKNGEQWWGRHGDIKPENILWFAQDQSYFLSDCDPMGVLQIADFGLGRFHSRESRSRVKVDTLFSSLTYEPPECKMGLPVSRAYDIWSLGCIYLEFITWLLQGSKAIDDFADYRGRYTTDTEIYYDDNFFTIVMEEGVQRATTREEVIDWSDKLHANHNCSQLIHDLLDFTISGLLVVETERRSAAGWVRVKLQQMVKRAGTDLEYLLKPVPVIRSKKANEESNHATAGILLDKHAAAGILLDKHATAGILLDNQPKGPEGSEQDSGYVSALRPGTLTASSEPASQGQTIELHRAGKLEEVKYPSENEIQSLLSDNDDIGSQASDKTTNEGMAGKALIRVFLAEEPQFRLLCEKAMGQMDEHRFVNNLRRLLKSFHKNLSAEAETEAEKAIARLLRSRRGRLRIGQQLAVQIQQEQEEGWLDSRVDLRIAPADKNRVERWLSHTSERPINPQGDEWTAECEFEDQDIDHESSTGSDDSSIGEEFPYIQDLKNFLRGTRSFRILLRDYMMMFLPTELRHVLLSIPKGYVWVTCEQDASVVNRMKAWVEDSTRVRWNWWPLESRKQMLRDGQSRMFWQCTCGVKQWEEISVKQHELIIKILALSDDKPQSPYWCRTNGTRVLLTAWFKSIFREAPPAPPTTSASSAAQKYSPPGGNVVTSPNGRSQSSPTNSIQLKLNQQRSLITSLRAQNTAPQSASEVRSYILFGVQGSRRTLTPSQVPINDQSTDSVVFQDLKKRYRTYRGRLRIWFSIWRLEYCEVVKFNRLALDRMVREHKDLPTDHDYEYSPRPGDPGAKNPPISPHLFQALFYTCFSPCNWPIPHDCLAPPGGHEILHRIPKRNSSFQNDQTSPIWGLEAVFAVSFAYVVIYHFIMVAGPFAFFGWWLIAHPDDLQNASVPVTVVLGALSLFWSGAGILKHGSIE